MFEAFVPLLFVVFALLILWLVFSTVGDMAEARGHSPWPWWIISVCWSPFGSMIVMWLFFPVLDEEETE